ncbi:SUMF1/EgtB/PvdO family nonheme iron enzyme [Thiothrix subterranea]|uniref:SUMF1/EgtB/PvdO family nonheme iron enzyme n=1 Tax=Thiothrix subterranea TaxID=2735563 RepID=UPI00192CCF39|nr:SUMF1/EgtB/PvdO family nonheme iron enzyme [Thiothrix subterranea]QQZ30569.1 SUMF1/EgtB/PvdO family nonheme iron enzyme [Thiothrix subterranea]
MSQPIRVFISYSHDDDAHREFVLRLANRLRTEQGIECLLDQHFLPGFPPQGWTKWMRDSVRDAKHVLMVCTPKYRNRYERNLENLEDTGRGVAFEGVVISQTLYEDYFHNHGLKFIPVLPSNGKRDDVPRELRDFSIYTLPDAFQQVCDLIKGVQYNPLPPLGSPPVRDTLETRVDAYLGWVQDTFLHSMDAYTSMYGKKRVRAQPPVRRKPFIGKRKFAILDSAFSGCREQELLAEKTFDNILEALNETGQGVFLGKPGAGKTTTLWKLADDEIRANKHRERKQRIVPVILRLGFWVLGGQSLQDFIFAKTNVVESMLGNSFSELLEQNRILLILDGLNELPIMQQQVKGEQIRDFLSKHPQVRAYASCREDDYSDDVRLPLPELHIQPLDIPRIQTFIRQYLEADNPEYLGQKAEELFWEIAGGQSVRDVWQRWEQLGASHKQFWDGEDIPRENPNVYSKTSAPQDKIWYDKVKNNPHSLMRLASNPYLLSMLMMVYDKKGAIPDNRGQLLEAFFQELISREVDPDEPKNNNERLQDGGKQLETLIGKLAWAMQAQTSTSRPDALAVMDYDEQWLKLAIRCNVLEQIGEDIRFSHQLLQDYFIAVGMKQRLDAKDLDAATFWKSDNWWEPTGWEEPTILLAGLYPKGCSPVVDWLKQANPKLAARCILESGVGCEPATVVGLAAPWLSRLTNVEIDPNPSARMAIGTAIARLTLDKRKGVGLNTKGLPDIDWVEIPAGKFIYQDSKRKKLPLDTFWMSRYPVTNAQFHAFVVADDGYGNDGWWQDLQKPETPHEPYWKENNRPVEQVDWYEAMAFCRWLSKKLDLDIRLPTEEQWEKAARGTDGREYPWGNGYKTGYANINETYSEVGTYNLQETSAVGLYPQGKSPYGLMDMSGNVWEWCLNKYDEPQITTADVSGGVRVVRGGAWSLSSVYCRSSSRSYDHPHDRFFNLGFRLLCCFPH